MTRVGFIILFLCLINGSLAWIIAGVIALGLAIAQEAE